MSQSLEKKLNGNWPEVLEYTREWGIAAAMKEYHVKDSFCMENYLKKHAPDEVFDYAKPEADDFSDTRAFDNLVEAFTRKITNMQTQLNDVMAKNRQLESQLEKESQTRWKKTRPAIENLMNLCKEN